MSQANKKKCPHCKKFRKRHDANMKKAYELGRLDAENRVKYTFNIMRASHRVLYDQLALMDKYDPLTDSPTTIKIDLVHLEKLIAFLRSNKHPSKARTLQRYIKSQLCGNGSKSKRQLRQFLSDSD